ncbi:TPA: winged helix-turn-helix domain-containing protein, partial [Escherichia coli]|nr:winged helix-turn-helix domain-containing protein [Escherichia coli]
MSIIINNWRMDPSLNALIHCETGETRRLGEYHFILLETLAKNADVVLSRSYLCAEVWKNRIVGGNSLPTAIHALRVAIDDDGKQQNIIKTIPKKGYLCNKEYVSLPDSSPAKKLIITDQIQETVPEEISSTTPPVTVRK